MNNNESYNKSRGDSAELSDDGCAAMTDDELQLYREILAEAYPKPKRDIKAGVMSAVRHETALKRKRAQMFSRSSMMRWGGLAASIVLVAAVGIRVLPSFLTKDSLVATSDTAQSETVPGISTAYTYTTGDNSGTLSYDIRANSPEEPADSAEECLTAWDEEKTASPASNGADASDDNAYAIDSVQADTVVTEDVMEDTAIDGNAMDGAEIEEAANGIIDEVMTEKSHGTAEESESETECAPSTDTDSDNAGMIITAECTHTGVFADSYHAIPDELIEHVGRDSYLLWAEENKASPESCGPHIRSFIEHFGITENVFGYYLTTTDLAYFYDYPLDILFGDAKDCESYYSAGGQYEKMLADHFEYRFKLALAGEIEADTYDAWLGKFPYQTVRAWSISEFVTEHDIPEPRFWEIYEEAADEFMKEYGVDSVHAYDTVKLYVNAVGIKMVLAASQLGYNADVMCRK